MEYTNKITKLLKIRFPIISAPMAGVSGGELARAVSKAGGLGLIGAGYSDVDWLQQQIELAADEQMGVGFITWQLAEKPEMLKLALAQRPSAIMLSFGDPKPFIDTIKASGAKLICQIQTLKDANEAAKFGADIIVAQGSEAGGHGASRGTFALVPAVVDAVSPIPVIAAGGIADGRGLAAALMLGAEAVLIGTRFYASFESLGHPNAKQLIVNADGDHTLRSKIFDDARELNWPPPFTARTLQNEFSTQWENEISLGKKMNDAIRNKYHEAFKRGDYSIAGVFAGEAVDLIHETLSAEQIVTQIMEETQRTLLRFKNSFCSLTKK